MNCSLLKATGSSLMSKYMGLVKVISRKSNNTSYRNISAHKKIMTSRGCCSQQLVHHVASSQSSLTASIAFWGFLRSIKALPNDQFLNHMFSGKAATAAFQRMPHSSLRRRGQFPHHSETTGTACPPPLPLLK